MPAPGSPTRSAHLAARGATVRAVILVLIGSIGVQFSSALSVPLFDTLGALGTSSLRLSVAAIILLAIFRPSLRGRTRADWFGILLYGIAMSTMNTLLFLAIDRIPLGIATTIDFLGPCIVALLGSRRPREGALALLAFAGVALIAGLGGPLDTLGLVFAALAGVSFGLYALLAARVGKSEGGLQNMSLSVAVAAILTLPFSVPAVPHTTPAAWGIICIAGLLGMALAFLVDTMAGRLTSARVIGVFFAFDPVVGTIVGALWLGQALTLPALAGIVLVVIAGAGIVWFAGQRRGDDVLGAEGRVEDSGVVETFEVERKYAVDEHTPLPGADAFSGLGLSAGESVVSELEARYFDTPGGALAAGRVAVRRRSGGKDAGWHLKERGDEGVRELQWPLSDAPPPGLSEEIERRFGATFAGAGAGRGAVAPIARLRTTRVTVLLRDAGGTAVVELADDRVDGTNELSGGSETWREWEAELMEGADPAWLDRVEPVLAAAGARRVHGTSKIQRTMALVPPPDTP